MEETFSHLPVTAVAIAAFNEEEEVVLVAAGGSVSLYHLDGKKKTGASVRVFRGEVVHGLEIQEKDGIVLAFGGKQVAVLVVDKCNSIRVRDGPIACVDRIMAVKWTGSDTFTLVTAHNRTLSAGIGSSNTIEVTNTHCCEEKCILYSAHVVITPTGESLILSGTVFQEIVIWSNRGSGGVQHRLRGHEGVIFSISFCRELAVICSTSDDRTARLWQVSFTNSDEDWATASISLSRVLRQHTSRVFRNLVLPKWDLVVSGGEDSALVFWPQSGDHPAAVRQGAHNGSPVWCLASNKSCSVVASGGGDGAVRIWDVHNILRGDLVRAVPLDCLSSGDFPRSLTMLRGNVVCLSNNGRLVVVSQANRQGPVVAVQNDAFRGYGLLLGLAQTLFVATLDGALHAFDWVERQGQTAELAPRQVSKVLQGKIFSLHAPSDSTVLVCGSRGKTLLLDAGDLAVKSALELPATGEQQWLESALMLEDRILVTGDRNGCLHVFNLARGDQVHPVQTLRGVHGRFGVGAIRRAGADTLWTAGRDGLLKLFRLDSDSCALEELNSSRMPLQWLEDVAEVDSDWHVMGFLSSNFVVYSLSEQRTLLSIPCGGSHRSWDLSVASEKVIFAFIRDKMLFSFEAPRSALARLSLRRSFHSREVSVAHHFSVGERAFLATAGEDTDIRVHEITSDGKEFELVSILRSHISCVKAIRTVSTADGNVVMASAGGRAQLKLWKMSWSSGSLVVVEMMSHLLKGNDKRRKKTWRDAQVIFDAETRYMDIDILQLPDDGTVHVVTACSDGILRTLAVGKSGRDVRVACQSANVQHCIQKALWWSACQVLSASTDGKLRGWSLNENNEVLEEMWSVTAHQSGVNCLHVHICGDVIVSGGDDGAIAVTRLSGWKPTGVTSTRAHNAQVTSVVTVRDSVISCSADQRLTVWRLNEDDSLEFRRQVCTDVADSQALALWESAGTVRAVVAGHGMSAFALHLDSVGLNSDHRSILSKTIKPLI